jgi:hypothetical protein
MPQSQYLRGGKIVMYRKAPWLLLLVFSLQSPSGNLSFGCQGSASQDLDFVSLPDHVAYEFYFLRVAFFYAKASARGQEDKTGEGFRSIITAPAALDDSQGRAVHEIAVTCLAQARELDLKARAIIREVRSRYHEGKLGVGQAPPELPPELATLQAQRNSIFLRGRDSLQKQLGDQKFAEFDRFVRSTIGQEQ